MTSSSARHPAVTPEHRPGAGTTTGDAGDPSDAGELAPSRHDAVVRAATAVIGGPLGRRVASTTGFWRALPVLVLMACAVLSLGIVQKQHCRAQGWSSPDQFWHACYSDIPVLYGSAGLGSEQRPGLSGALDVLGQPPLSGALMWVTSAFVPQGGTTAPREFFDLSAVLLIALLAVGVAAVALVKGRRPWDAAHLALSPVLVTAGLISYQLLAVALAAAAVLVLARGRAVLGGVLLGLAVLAAPPYAVIVPAAALFAHRVRVRSGPAVLGAAVVTWLVLRAVLLPGIGGGLGGAFDSWRSSEPGYGSIWLLPQLLHDSRPDNPVVLGRLFDFDGLGGTSSAIGSVVLMAALIVAVLQRTVLTDLGPDHVEGPRPSEEITARFGPLALALVAAVLLSVKSLPVQASLLLLPFLALAGLRWRDHLVWAVTELVYFVGIWLYIAGETTPSRGLPAPFYLTLVVARLAGIAWVGVQGVLAHRSRALVPPISDPADDAGTLLAGPGATY